MTPDEIRNRFNSITVWKRGGEKAPHKPLLEEAVHKFMKAMVEGIRFFKMNKKESMRVMAKYMRNEDLKIVEVGYDYESEVYERAPYPLIGGIQSALEEIAQENPAARKADVKRFYDARWVQELDKSGFINELYK